MAAKKTNWWERIQARRQTDRNGDAHPEGAGEYPRGDAKDDDIPPPLEGEPPKPPFPEPILASRLQRSQGVDWLWYGYLAPGSMTLMSALWKSGKTTLLAHLLRAFEQGGDFCGLRVAPSRVLYVTEESEHRWAGRRDALGLKDHLSFLVRPFHGRPKWEEWKDFIAYLGTVCAVNPCDLIVFDPLVNLWPVRDENDNAQVGAALLPLQALTKNRAILLVHHMRKGDGQEATASRGAGALPAFVDTIMEMRRYCPADHKDRRRVLTSHGRDDETVQELVIELTEAGEYVTHGDKREAGRNDLLPILDDLLPVEPPGWTTEQIIGKWPGDSAPRKERVLDALRLGTETGRWLRDGTGKKGRPYLYWRPQKDSVSVPPLYREGTETESEERIETPFDSPRPYTPPEADDV